MLDAEIDHTIQLDGTGPADYRSVVAFFARQLLKDLRLVGGYDVLYPKVKAFMREHLFTASSVNLEDPVVLRNLSEPDVGKVLYDCLQGRHQCPDHSGPRTPRASRTASACAKRAPSAPRPRRFLAAKQSHLQPDRRRGPLRRLRTPLRRLPGRRARRAGLRQELPRRRLQARLRQGRRRPVQLHPRLSSSAPRTAPSGSSRPRAARNSTCRRKWHASSCGAPTPPPPRRTANDYDFVYVDQPSFEKHTPHTFAALVANSTEYKIASCPH